MYVYLYVYICIIWVCIYVCVYIYIYLLTCTKLSLVNGLQMIKHLIYASKS